MSIYAQIRVPMDALWAHTQTPALHERWDLRFLRIVETLPLPATRAKHQRVISGRLYSNSAVALGAFQGRLPSGRG